MAFLCLKLTLFPFLSRKCSKTLTCIVLNMASEAHAPHPPPLVTPLLVTIFLLHPITYVFGQDVYATHMKSNRRCTWTRYCNLYGLINSQPIWDGIQWTLCTYCKLYHTQHTGHSTIERDPSSQLCVEGIQNFFQTLLFKNRLKKSKSTFTHWWKKYSSIFMPTYKQKYYWIKCEA